MQSTAYYTSNIYVNNCFLWQARIQLDMQYLHIKILGVFKSYWMQVKIYMYIYLPYTHTFIYICIKVYIHLCIYTVYIYTHRYMLKVDFIFFRFG